MNLAVIFPMTSSCWSCTNYLKIYSEMTARKIKKRSFITKDFTTFIRLQKVIVIIFFILVLPSLPCPLNALKIEIPHPKWKLAPKYLHMQARRAHPYPLEPFLPFQHYNVNLVNKQLHPQLEGKEVSVSFHEHLYFGRVITVSRKTRCK